LIDLDAIIIIVVVVISSLHLEIYFFFSLFHTLFQLVRRVTRQMLFALKGAEFEDEAMKHYADALNKTVLQVNKCPKGLILHICDFYIEEIAKVADGEISDDRTQLLLEPFIIYYAKLSDPFLLNHIEKNVFNQLMTQSELGQSYEEKFDIWKRANFPTRSIDDIEIKYQVRGNKSLTDDDLSDGEEEDEEERALDPRAGRVNVTLSEINFDAAKLAETLENLRYKHFVTSKSRKGLARIASKLRKFAEGVYPLGIKVMPGVRTENEDSKIDIDLKAIQLAEFEKKLALGDVDSESSDFDEDLDNRKHGKLKRKSKEENATKVNKEKKQKLSKLHNERFFKEHTEDFSQDNTQQEDDDDLDDENEKDENNVQNEVKVVKKKKKKSQMANGDKSSDENATPRKIKLQKRKKKSSEVENVNGTTEVSPSSKGSTQPFKECDEWSEPLKDGEVEFFVPSRKQKLKALQAAEATTTTTADDEDSLTPSTSKLLVNPFAKQQNSSVPAKKLKMSEEGAFHTPKSSSVAPRIKASSSSNTNSGKRVIIALNKNIAQSENDYIKQVRQSPNLPTNNLSLKPTKSLLKPNALPSPINPFYQKKIGLKIDFSK
jgi:ribosomal RNA-processing protein 1